MTDERIEGIARGGVGRVQDAVGGLTGDGKLQVEGKINQAKGSVQDAYGKVKGQAEDMLSDTRGTVRETLEGAEQFVMDKPVAGLAIAAGLGLLLGLFIARDRS